jgi:hypothetical protein
VSSWWIILFVNKSTLTACLRNRDHLKLVRETVFQLDDKVIQVIREEDGRRLIDAPGAIIHMHRWQRNGRRVTFVYLEMPKARRISLEKLAKRLGYGAKKKLQRNGLVRDPEFSEALYKNWKMKS